MTSTQAKQFIQTNLPDDAEITASQHRSVESMLVDYIDALAAIIPKLKVLTLDYFTVNRNYSVDTGIPTASVIKGVYLMLECKAANNGFAVGDTVTAPTPYPTDSGRTSAQGMAAQYSATNSATVKIVINDQLTIMKPYSVVSNAPGDYVLLSGSDLSNWVVKLFVNYV